MHHYNVQSSSVAPHSPQVFLSINLSFMEDAVLIPKRKKVTKSNTQKFLDLADKKKKKKNSVEIVSNMLTGCGRRQS